MQEVQLKRTIIIQLLQDLVLYSFILSSQIKQTSANKYFTALMRVNDVASMSSAFIEAGCAFVFVRICLLLVWIRF